MDIVETGVLEKQPWFRRLYLPTYRVGEAARYAGVHHNTVSAWFFRGNPVLHGHKHGEPLSYLQLVEVAFVAFFRRMKVPMERIRAARMYVAQIFSEEFPFARYQFKTEGMHVLMRYHGFEPFDNIEDIIVADKFGQLAWGDFLGDKFAEFDYEYELAMRWHPDGPNSQVVIDPRFAFGAPVVQNLPTWVVKGRFIAGESPEEIADDFGITTEGVFDALHFEGVVGVA